jgi:hypothetical protein
MPDIKKPAYGRLILQHLGLGQIAASPRLQRTNGGSLGTLGTSLHGEFNTLVFLQSAETFGLNFRKMREQIFAAFIGLDEAEALGLVKPFHSTGSHESTFKEKIEKCKSSTSPENHDCETVTSQPMGTKDRLLFRLRFNYTCKKPARATNQRSAKTLRKIARGVMFNCKDNRRASQPFIQNMADATASI